jgi:geranylgeranyl diphosphate synthase type I
MAMSAQARDGDTQAQRAAAFEQLRARVAPAVEAELARLLDARVDAAKALGADAAALVDAVRALALRGGKRLRAVLLAAAHEAAGGEAARVVMAAVAVELLQTYLLIHDDVMDGDELRRGGPSVHAMLRERFGGARSGESGAILAGDLACSLAQQALLAVPVPAERLASAAKELGRMQEEVVYGQLLDLRAEPATSAEVERTYALKTGSYTVRGPLLIGAVLAGAKRALIEAMERFAEPLGVAFQLRDDLLGTFGDPTRIGKPVGRDLREGKRTSLVVELEAGDAETRALLGRVLGVAGAADADVRALVARMEACGARRRVEQRIDDLAHRARGALASLPSLAGPAQRVLDGAVSALTERDL